MSTSLSSLVNNLPDGLHNDKCTDCKSCLDYMLVKDNQLIVKCLKCNKYHNKEFKKDLINRYASTYKFCDGHVNNFILLLRKGVYPYEYMDSWERFDETSLSNNEDFFSGLNMEDITDIVYRHAKEVFKELKMNNLGNYHDFIVQSDTLLLAYVFENFRNKCFKIYELDPTYLLSAPALAWQACLKKTEVKLELLTDINMLLIIEEEIRGGIAHAVHRYAKANNKYMKNYDKNKELPYLMYLDANNLYGWTMSQKLSVNGFKWKTNMSMFNEEFIKKIMMRIVMKDIFLK